MVAGKNRRPFIRLSRAGFPAFIGTRRHANIEAQPFDFAAGLLG
jgi:hypothetical protein